MPAIVGLFITLPDTPYDRLFPLGMAILMFTVAYYSQHKIIDAAVQKGGARKSFWKLAGVMLAALGTLFLGLVMVLALFDVKLV